MLRPSIATLVALGLVTAASAQTPPATATAEIKNAEGATLGTATLTGAPKGVLLRIEAKGLMPGWHGMHFHEKGDCSDAEFKKAGGHVHGDAALVHGLLNPAATDSGDLPNIFVATDGSVTVELYSAQVALAPGADRPALLDADGAALVIHANPDDYATQPIGGAGARVACGVIK